MKDFFLLPKLASKFKDPNSLVRSFSISSSWNALIIIVQFILSPIIARIYPPEVYGLFAIYSSLTINISVFMTLKYGDAIVLQETLEKRNRVIALSLMLVGITACLAWIVFFLVGDRIAGILGDQRLSQGFLLVVPLAVAFAGLLEVLISVNICEKKFTTNGLSGFVFGGGARLSAVMYGFFIAAQAKGLIIGDLLGKAAASFVVILSMRNWHERFRTFCASVSPQSLNKIARELKSFPLYFLPSSVLFILAGHLPIFLLQYKFGSAVVGSFGMAVGVLEIFNKLIPYSIAPNFLRKANEIYRTSPHLLPQKVFAFFVALTLIGTGLFSVMAGAGTLIFSWLLGAHWRTAGSFAAVLAVSYAFVFVSAALGEVFNVLGRQRLFLSISIIGMALRVLALILIVQFDYDAFSALLIFSIVGTLSSVLVIGAVFFLLPGYSVKVACWMGSSLIIIMAGYWLGNLW